MKNDIFHHERIYRGSLDKIAETHITVCGAGALGSNLVDNLARQGFTKLRVIDMDRVEQHNINTQIYNRSHVGTLKVASLKTIVFQAVGVEIEDENKKLDEKNIKKLLKKTDIVIDCFDNSESRRIVTEYCLNNNIECLHIGLAEDFAEIIWNKNYKVPKDTSDSVAPCDVGLARNIILLAVATGSEILINFVENKIKDSCYITLKDTSIRKT